MHQENLVDIKQAALAVGLSRWFLYRLVAEGKLPHYRAGKAIRFRISEVEMWMRTKVVKE